VTMAASGLRSASRFETCILQEHEDSLHSTPFKSVRRLDVWSGYEVLKSSGGADAGGARRVAVVRLRARDLGRAGLPSWTREFYRPLIAAGAFDYYFHVKRFMSLRQPLVENRSACRRV
jgi:hypothetical protein